MPNTIDLDALEVLRNLWEIACNEGPSDHAIATFSDYNVALRNAAPALIAAARERDELRGRLNANEELHRACQTALTAAYVRIAEFEGKDPAPN